MSEIEGSEIETGIDDRSTARSSICALFLGLMEKRKNMLDEKAIEQRLTAREKKVALLRQKALTVSIFYAKFH
ncbi:MAG: hypothetical protein C4288_18905 [Leptolyngbya sp. ERB_1_1]